MKFKKKTIILLALCWIVGIAGGYFIGIESASIPTENIDYNYYSKDYARSSVKTVEPEQSEEEEGHLTRFIRSLHLMDIPKKIYRKVISPSACTTPCKDQPVKENTCNDLA